MNGGGSHQSLLNLSYKKLPLTEQKLTVGLAWTPPGCVRQPCRTSREINNCRSIDFLSNVLSTSN